MVVPSVRLFDLILLEFPDHRRLADAEQPGGLAGGPARFLASTEQLPFIGLEPAYEVLFTRRLADHPGPDCRARWSLTLA